MKKKLCAIMLVGCMLCTLPVQAQQTLTMDGQMVTYNTPTITLYVNNKEVPTTSMSPVQMDGRVLVPTREVFEAMGATVHWEGKKQTVTVKYKTTTIVLKVDEKTVLVNGKNVTLDVPAKVINGKVMIPIRFVSENIGMKVVWDNVNKAVWINEPQNNDSSSGNDSSSNGVTHSYTGTTIAHNIQLPSAQYSMAAIQSVQVAESSNRLTATIAADGPISDTVVSMQIGKVIVDIKNSKSKLASSISPSSNTYVKSIRTSQFTSDTTRIVFDLKSGATVKANYSSDRSKVYIELTQAPLQGLNVKVGTSSDTIQINGIVESQISITTSGASKQIKWQIPNMKISSNIQWINIKGSSIAGLSVVQSGNHLVGTITLSQLGQATLESTNVGVNLIVTPTNQENIEPPVTDTPSDTPSVTPPPVEEVVPPTTSEPMVYVTGTKPAIKLYQLSGITSQQLKVTDNYRDRQIILDLGKDYSKVLKNTTKTVSDGVVKNIQVDTTDGKTRVIVNTNTVYAYYVYVSNGTVQLQLVKPNEKYNQIVVVDIGHGGSDAGAVGNGLTEKAINFNQGMALYRLLEADSKIKVYMTRETDVYPTLKFRTTLANEIEADLFVSIHNNAASSTAAKGTETLYYPSSSDLRGEKVARLVQDAIVTSCNMTDRGIKARTNLHVLNATNMPAILIETGFISHPTEAILINTPSYISVWAQNVYEAIVEGFKIL